MGKENISMKIQKNRKSILISITAVGLLAILALPGLTLAKAKYANGNLVRQKNKGTIFLIQNGKKRPVLSVKVLRQRKLHQKRVKRLSGSVINKIPTGRLLVHKNSTLLKARGKGTIWIISRQKRKSISSMSILRALGYRSSNIRKIRLKKLKKIPYGGAMTLSTNRLIKVTANKSYWITDQNNRKLIKLAAKETAQIGYKNGIYLISIPGRHKTFQRKTWIKIQPATGGICQIKSYDKRYGYNRFRGTLQIRYSSRSNRLWAINRLSLENYLKGMGEAGDTRDPYPDRLTYQKTMAAIARSYAAYYIQRGGRHQGEPFHMKNSRFGNGMDQVYHGYKREFANQIRAVNRTQGVVVTNSSNNILITPYSHGGYVKESKTRCLNRNGKWLKNRKICLRTKSSKEVWGGAISHCQPAYDPYTDRHWRCGTYGNHCVGLSAVGAIGYANRGKTYSWILKHYYRNIKVINKHYNPKIKVSIYGIKP